jgi:CheY-like chemotaxis protein
MDEIPTLPAGTRLSFLGAAVHRQPLVLLVEDDSKAREGYAEFLEGGGFRVAQCGSAEDACTRSLELVPDIVVTDIALPGRDGFALAADLRVQARTRGIPVVAMTAYWASDVHDRAEAVGITTILMKPCQPDHLLAELRRVLQRARLPRLAQPASVAYTPRPARASEAKGHS